METELNLAFNKMLGRQLRSVELNHTKDAVTFNFKDGFRVVLGAKGECCSVSWIEHLEMPNSIDGAIITKIGESDGIPWDKHECTKKGNNKHETICGHEYLKFYFHKFSTNKGDIIIEYRNDSNGYYGGNLFVIEQSIQKVR